MAFLQALLWIMRAILVIPLCIGVGAWTAYEYFFRTEFPPGICDPIKMRLGHIIFTLSYALDYTGWRFGFCKQHTVMRFIARGIPPCRQDPKLHIKDLQFDGVAVRLYQPRGHRSMPKSGILLFHGGIGMWGNVDSVERMCRSIARESDSVVVSVEYRLAPESPYPTQFMDCRAASIHLLRNAKAYGVDPDCIMLCGDSLGGGLAAAVSQDLVQRADLPRVRATILLYPFLQAVDFNLPSHQQNHLVPPFFQSMIVKLGLQYLGIDTSLVPEVQRGSHIPEDLKAKWKKWIHPDLIPKEFKVRGYTPPPAAAYSPDVYQKTRKGLEMTFSPLLAEDNIICQLPETYLLSCEYDVLRDDCLLYKRRLEDAGVRVTWHHLEDGFHGVIFTVGYSILSFTCAKRGLDSVVNFVKQVSGKNSAYPK